MGHCKIRKPYSNIVKTHRYKDSVHNFSMLSLTIFTEKKKIQMGFTLRIYHWLNTKLMQFALLLNKYYIIITVKL